MLNRGNLFDFNLLEIDFLELFSKNYHNWFIFNEKNIGVNLKIREVKCESELAAGACKVNKGVEGTLYGYLTPNGNYAKYSGHSIGCPRIKK